MTKTLYFTVLIFLIAFTISKKHKKAGYDTLLSKFMGEDTTSSSANYDTNPKVSRSEFKGSNKKNLFTFDDYLDFVKNLNERKYSTRIILLECCSNVDNTITFFYNEYQADFKNTVRHVYPYSSFEGTCIGTSSTASVLPGDYVNQLYVKTDPTKGLSGIRWTTSIGLEVACGEPANEPLMPPNKALYAMAGKFDSIAVRAMAAYYVKAPPSP